MKTTNASAATKYQQNQISQADPVQLIVLLYDGALSRIAQAKQRLGEGDAVYAGVAVSKAQAIVAQLRNSLNMEAGGEIAENLNLLYLYLHELFVKVMRENDSKPLDEATVLLNELRGAWADLAKQVKELQEKAQTVHPPVALNEAAAEIPHLQVKA
jgi:flagellar secretion chaperone FliS